MRHILLFFISVFDGGENYFNFNILQIIDLRNMQITD